MRIISIRILREFWVYHTDAENALRAWYYDAKSADWKTPDEIKSKYANASILNNNRVVFNIHGNKYRLVVAVNYPFGIIYIRFIGTHQKYDRIDAETI